MTNSFTIQACNQMISHYLTQSANMEKTEAWRSLARISAADWRVKLERAMAA